MNGSTFIHAPEEEALRNIDWKGEPDWSEFRAVDLQMLITLDFSILLAKSNIPWMDGQPIYYDEEGGLAVMKINPMGLTKVLERRGRLDLEQQPDLDRLRRFLNEYGNEHIYEVAAF
jgi:hypothetical protein